MKIAKFTLATAMAAAMTLGAWGLVQEGKQPEAPKTIAPAGEGKPGEKKMEEEPKVSPPCYAKHTAMTGADRNNQPGWPQRHEKFNARAKQGAEKGDIDLIFMGDSITEGWEGPGKEVWAEFYGNRNAVNMGISGDRTQHLLWRIENGNLEGLEKPKAGHAPKLVVVMIGTNNSAGKDHTAQEIADGVQAVVMAARAKLPQTPVLLLGIFPAARSRMRSARRTPRRVHWRRRSRMGRWCTTWTSARSSWIRMGRCQRRSCRMRCTCRPRGIGSGRSRSRER